MLVLSDALPHLLQRWFSQSSGLSGDSTTSSGISGTGASDQARMQVEHGRYRGDEFDAYAMMAPQYAYGRHRGPAPRQTLKAAVLIALIKGDDGKWSVPLTLRPAQLQDHAGQVSLPGGRSERREDARATAYREFDEELGWSSAHLTFLGTLSPIYVYASRHRVIPCVAFSEANPTFHPNADEVAELLLFPIDKLMDPNSIDVGILQRGTMQFKAPGYWIGEHFVWGATAMILTEFREILYQIFQDA